MLCVVAGVVDSMALLLTGAVLLGARPPPTAARGTPPPTSPRTRTRAARSPRWSGRPRSARCSGPTYRAGRRAGATARDPRADRRSRSAASGCVLAGDRGRRAAAAGPAAARPGRARSTSQARTGRSWARFAEAVGAQPALGVGDRRAWRAPRGDGRGDDHDAAAHGARWRRSCTVIGFVISVHVLGMFAFSPLVGLAADRVGGRRCCSGGRTVADRVARPVRRARGGLVVADLPRPVRARPRLVVRDRRGLDDHHRRPR